MSRTVVLVSAIALGACGSSELDDEPDPVPIDGGAGGGSSMAGAGG